jgi:hypothetical protein
MPVAETACGDNVVGPVRPPIALRPEVLRSGLVPHGSLARNAESFAEGLDVSSPHRLATVVTQATLLVHGCFSVLGQSASHELTSLMFRVGIETDVQQLHLQLPLSWKLYACTRQHLIKCYSEVSCRQCCICNIGRLRLKRKNRARTRKLLHRGKIDTGLAEWPLNRQQVTQTMPSKAGVHEQLRSAVGE